MQLIEWELAEDGYEEQIIIPREAQGEYESGYCSC